MSLLLKIAFIFLGANVFISVPLFFFVSKTISIDCFISLLFYTLVWILIVFLTSLAQKGEVDLVSSGLAIKIGLKFIGSMFFIGTMIWTNTFTEIASILFFLLFYFIFSFLIIFVKE